MSDETRALTVLERCKFHLSWDLLYLVHVGSVLFDSLASRLIVELETTRWLGRSTLARPAGSDVPDGVGYGHSSNDRVESEDGENSGKGESTAAKAGKVELLVEQHFGVEVAVDDRKTRASRGLLRVLGLVCYENWLALDNSRRTMYLPDIMIIETGKML